jgi:hypothetical protein
MMVKPTVVYGSDTWAVTEMDMKTGYRGKGNIKKDTWTRGKARNVENKNKSGI